MSGASLKSLSIRNYTVACICPLPVEVTPVLALRDEEHDAPYDISTRSQNAYLFGTMGRHNVVVANIHQVGTNAAATVAASLLNDFPCLRFTLLVGIGGGVPGDSADIRLGDVVVSQAHGSFSGVVQYDLGKMVESGFERIGQLNQPPRILTNHVLMLQAVHSISGSKIKEYFIDMLARNPKMRELYGRPEQQADYLFETNYHHLPGRACEQCDPSKRISRESRKTDEPYVHYGLVGSANAVVKNAVDREKLKQDLGIICLEMEAAGIMNDLPCLVIRGICDYADSHKNDAWRAYAAAVAAAYMKELLISIPPQQVTKITLSSDVAAAGNGAPVTDIINATSHKLSLVPRRNVESVGERPWKLNITNRSRSLPLSPVDTETGQDTGPRQSIVAHNEEQKHTNHHTWNLEYESLRTSDPAVAALLKLLGYYDNADLWYDLFCLNKDQAKLSLKSKMKRGIRGMAKMVRASSADTPQRLSELIGNQEEFERSMKVLIDKKFVKNHYRFLPGVHEWILTRTTAALDPNYYWFAFDCISGLIDGIERKDQAYIENDVVASHAARLMDGNFDAVGKEIDQTRLIPGRTVAEFLALHVRDGAAAEMYHRVLSKANTTWGPQDVRTAYLHADLGRVYMDQGRYRDAEKMLEDSLRIIEARYGPQAPKTLEAASDVALAYGMLNKFDEAERSAERALRIDDGNDLGEDKYLSLAQFRYCFGQCCFRTGKFDVAERHLQRCLNERKRLLGFEHRTTVATLNYLGHIQFQNEELGAAVLTYNTALQASIKCYGFGHPRTIRTSIDLALAYLEQNRLVDAERLLASLRAATETISIVTKISPEFDLYFVLGCLFIKQGDLTAAEQMLMQALSEQERIFGPDHISAMWTCNYLGVLYRIQGKLPEAERNYERVLAFCKEHRTPYHRITRKATEGLTLIHKKQRQTNEVYELECRTTEGEGK